MISACPNPMKLTPFATSVSLSSPNRKAPCSSSLFGMGVEETALAEPQTSLNGSRGALAGSPISSIQRIYFSSRRSVMADTDDAILKPKHLGQLRLLALAV